MILTEEEAKTKWCPHVRIPADNVGGGINRDSAGNTVRATCIASECSAWRWAKRKWHHGDKVIPDPKTMGELKKLEDDPAAELKPIGGYCGLAGNPND